jgi:ABC-2 type transport system permease protein
MTNRSLQSMTSAAGGTVAPMEVMRPFTRTTALAIGGAPVPSNNAPQRIARVVTVVEYICRMTAAYLMWGVAGFRRFATYRQAMVAATFTNTVFGFLRSAVMLAVAGAAGAVGYDAPQLLTFVWVGQGLIGVVLLWAPTDLADRIRSGDVIVEMLRPMALVWQLLAGDLGRATYALLTRFVAPIAIGALVFDLYVPRRLTTYILFACSVGLATVVSFGCRFLVNAAAYWLLDARGPQIAWTLCSGVLGGLYFPIWFLPGHGAVAVIAATPFPSIIQLPLDVLVERGDVIEQLTLIGVQAAWAIVMLATCLAVQRRGERKLVVQGG